MDTFEDRVLVSQSHVIILASYWYHLTRNLLIFVYTFSLPRILSNLIIALQSWRSGSIHTAREGELLYSLTADLHSHGTNLKQRQKYSVSTTRIIHCIHQYITSSYCYYYGKKSFYLAIKWPDNQFFAIIASIYPRLMASFCSLLFPIPYHSSVLLVFFNFSNFALWLPIHCARHTLAHSVSKFYPPSFCVSTSRACTVLFIRTSICKYWCIFCTEETKS